MVGLNKRIKFKLVPYSEVSDQNYEPDWLIEGYLERNTLVTLISPPDSFKSFLAVDFCLSLASGKDWHGHEVKKQYTVWLIIGEGFQGIKKRISAWCNEYDIDPKNLNVFISDRPADVFNNFQDEIENNNNISRPDLILIDTLSRNSGYADENSSKDMAKIIGNLDQIKFKFNCTILIVHHTPWSDPNRARGSSVLFGSADFEYVLKRDSMRLNLTCKKSKDHALPPPKSFIAIEVETGHLTSAGQVITSVILKLANSDTLQHNKLGKNQKLVRDCFVRLKILEKERMTNEGYNPNNARVLITNIYKESELTKKQVNEAINGMGDRGVIQVSDGYISD